MLLCRRSVSARFALAVLLLAIVGSVANADMLVAWRDSARVSRYSDSWSSLGDFVVLPGGTRPMNAVQDKSTGDVYVRVTTDISSPTAGSVIKYDQHGNLVAGWSVTGLSYGKGLAVRGDKVFVADATAQTVKWYSTSDSSVSQSLSSGSDAMGPVEALAFDSQGKLFAAGGSTIKRWDADLNYLGIVVGDSANLTDIKMMPGSDGIRALRWDGYLLGWDNDGVWTGPYYRHAPPPWPQAIWISPAGDYYRTAAYTAGVQKLDAATATWQTVVSEGSGYSYPMGINHFEMITPKLRAQLILQNYVGDPSLIRVRIDILQGGSVVQSKTVAPGTTQPIVDFELDPGTYTVRANAGKWIGAEGTVVVPPGNGYTPITLVLANGDVDGNNHVGTADFSILSENYGEAGD